MRHSILTALMVLSLAAPAATQDTDGLPDTSLSGNFLPKVLETSAVHRDSLMDMIKGKPGLPFWVRTLVSQPRYVALASEEVVVSGERRQLFRACEAGRCDASRLVAIFSADGKHAVLKVSDAELGVKFFGDPTPDELVALAN
ncbi:Ivy family c-type lysozyme inhibitor [Rhizobium sp. AG855]|uniref:Ivy family c-type lysozyme inhibitor n=1 Tax=Rhizobium sp. AG855 TaxID=2183898 RepID=UPI000FF49373|nr:Ivy family c-type lysozyme inhibitor [Rhizobium sp. AG855]RKE85762.1 inhibitor of lysozyme (Ivy) [Rhizobium sp. AG855]